MVSLGAFALSLRISLAARFPARVYAGRRHDLAASNVRLRVPLSLITGLAVVASSVVALRLGSIGGSLKGSFGRQHVGSGYLYLVVNLAGLSVLVALASLPIANLKVGRTRMILTCSFVAFLGIHLLVLGGRAEIIIITLSALIITTMRLARPRKSVLVAALFCATFVLALDRVATREAYVPGNETSSPASLAMKSLRDPLGLVTRDDVSAYDKLVLLEESHGPLRHGETYVAALLGPLPGKGRVEGGNRAFTKQFLPSRYERHVTYEGISLLGEAWFNFGLLGPPFVGVLTGWVYGALLRKADRSRAWLLVFALATGTFPSLVRADLLNTLALGGSLVVFSLLIMKFVITRIDPRWGVAGEHSVAVVTDADLRGL
jgi:hypothetical protein